MYATSVNKITKLSVLSIGISINISFHTPVLVLWTYILQQGYCICAKRLNESSAISSQGW